MAYFFKEPSHTFSEYLLVPGYSSSECIPANVSLKTPVVKFKKGEECPLTMNVPISHGEGRFLCQEELLRKLAENGQIATQYVDLNGAPTMDVDFNPNGSVWAIEGITSPDGRILGKMGHAERVGPGLYRNVPGDYDLHLFEAAKDYFAI